jgi:hypothetical protein
MTYHVPDNLTFPQLKQHSTGNMKTETDKQSSIFFPSEKVKSILYIHVTQTHSHQSQ